MSSYVLITRPEAEAQNLADIVAEHGFKPFIEPLLMVEALDFDLPDLEQYQALVFTSANAVRVASKQIEGRDCPVYCVGAQTEEVARGCGWLHVKAAGGNVKALAAFLAEENLNPDAPLLHLAGQDIAAPIIVPGFVIECLAVYKAQQAEALSPECLCLLKQKDIEAVLFFSVRTAQAFAALLEKYERTESISSIKALCLSDSVLRSVSHLPWQDVRAAKAPDAKALVELLN